MKTTKYRPKKSKKAKTHGFFRRMSTKAGRNTIKRRRLKRRRRLSL